MYHALDLGLTVRDFWDMTPRAIVLLQKELSRSMNKGNKHTANIGGRSVQSEGRRLSLSALPKP